LFHQLKDSFFLFKQSFSHPFFFLIKLEWIILQKHYFYKFYFHWITFFNMPSEVDWSINSTWELSYKLILPSQYNFIHILDSFLLFEKKTINRMKWGKYLPMLIISSIHSVISMEWWKLLFWLLLKIKGKQTLWTLYFGLWMYNGLASIGKLEHLQSRWGFHFLHFYRI
jgi:hypothetical protein